mgnify:FL=1|jgi:hypothetical protein
MKELTQIYKDAGQQLIEDLFKDYLVVSEKLSGSSFSFKKNGEGITFYKGGNQKPINLIDRTIMVYYEKPINFIKSVTSKNLSSIPEDWKFCFQYFVNTNPGIITYDRLPKNNLVLTHIKVMTPAGKVTKVIEDPRVIRDWANALGVTPLLPLFKGYLTEDQKKKIKEFLETPKEDHAEIFSTNSFAEYLLRILNPNIQSTTLQNDLKKPIESIVFKFYKSGTKQVIAAKLIDPYTINLMKEKEPIDMRKAPADINEIILLDLLAFIEERGIKKHEILGDGEDMRYIELVSNIFNDYVTKRGKDIAKIDIEKADFAKGKEFDLNVELIPSQRTKDILNSNPKLKDLFKIILGSLKKKRKNAGNIMTPSVIEDFNKMVDKVTDVIQTKDDGKFKTFDDYLKIKSTNESLLPNAEELLIEDKVLDYNNFINLGKVIVEEKGKTLIKNKKTGDEYEVKNPDPKKHEIVEPGGKSNKTDEPRKDSSEKMGKLTTRVEDKVKEITDPTQKKNAEAVLDAVKIFNNPDASMEDKVEQVKKLNDAGLIFRNSESAKATKMYLDSSATGLSRKELIPDTGSPSEMAKAMKEFGLDKLQGEGGKIGRKEMTGAKLFGEEKVVKVKTKVLDNGIQIGEGKIEKTKIPSDEKLLSVYGSKEEADLAKKYLERRNKIVDEAMKSFKDGDMSIIEPVSNTPPNTSENRKKLKDATSDTIREGFDEQFKKTGRKPNAKQQEVLDGFSNLKDIKDPKEYDKKLHDLTEELFADPFFDSATADVAELVTYMSELNKGNEVYMPSASNYPLGDIISISPEKIDFEKDSPEEIQRKVQLIYNGVEARSIKKGAGGASASGVKTDMSEFKEITNKKGDKISPKDVKNDLSDLSNKDKVYKELMFGDASKAESTINNIAEKYDFDLEDPKFKARRDKSVQSAINNILSKPKCEGTDEKKLKQKLDAYFNQGEMYESLYNENVKEQLFVNEQYKYSKTKGLDVNRTDGVKTMAKVNFAFSAGSWSCDGRPSNPVPTRFVNDKS